MARPKGSKNKRNARRMIENYFTEADIDEFFEFLKDNYKEDPKLMQWVGDHLLGKPQQSIDHHVTEEPTPILDVPKNDRPAENTEAQKEA